MNPVVLVEAWWAKHHVKLAAEPAGERQGICSVPEGSDIHHSGAGPLTLVAIGDSMAVGCGVTDQNQGFIPAIAQALASRMGRSVQWSAHGRLGATIRRVRYRLLPGFTGHADLLVVCAGSNDIMANRSWDEWRTDLAATIEEAKSKGNRVLVLSSGQLYRDPALGKALRAEVERRIDRQTAISKEVCARAGVTYVDATHDDVGTDREDFWGIDHFHPGCEGYRRMADCVVGKLPESFISELRAA